MPGLAEIGGRNTAAVQAERDAVIKVELAFERRGRLAALPTGDLLCERADLGPHRRDFAGFDAMRETAGGVDRGVRQMASGIRLEAVLKDAPAGQVDRSEGDAAILYECGVEPAARLEQTGRGGEAGRRKLRRDNAVHRRL